MVDIEEIVVDGSDRSWAKTKSPCLLYSGGFGPCIVVAVYNHSTKVGHMWHSPIYSEGLNSMLDDAARGRGSRRLSAWVRGGAHLYYGLIERASSKDAEYASESFRKGVLDALSRRLPAGSIDVCFLGSGYSGEVTLDTKTGLLEEVYETEDYTSSSIDDF
ncbi:MAG: hypothetical protein AABY09_05690 [Nanoarchaeota archaeon]